MKTILLSLLTASLLPTIALAQVSLNSTRVTAQDVLATEAFYMQAFGMHEVNRIQMGNGNIEVMLNFGASAEAAKANTGAQIVIMHSDQSPAGDPVAHVIFTVADAKATAAAVTAAGGSMEREPFEFGDTGIFIGMGHDPAGNRIELIQQPSP